MSTVQEIEQAALKLTPKKRAKLAEFLLESLETKRNKKIAEAWANEASSRAEAYRLGKLKAISLRRAFGFEV